jgi:hypothetical protein
VIGVPNGPSASSISGFPSRLKGPFGTPITDSQRVKVKEGTAGAWIVAYLPRGVVTPEAAGEALDSLLAGAAVARVEETGVSR